MLDPWVFQEEKRVGAFLSLFAIRESEKVNGGGRPFKGKNGLTMGVVLVDYTCHFACDAIKRWEHMANFHWAPNLNVMTKVPYM